MSKPDRWYSLEDDKIWLVGSLESGFKAYRTVREARKARRYWSEPITEISVWTEGVLPNED